MADAKGAGQGSKRQTAKGQSGAGRRDTGEVDALFQLPLVEFTAARNALAAQLKKDGSPERAAEVKSLAKPSLSAWVANQLYWRYRAAFDRLMSTGERFRSAQAAQLSGKPADLRGALEERRAALSELARLAADTLRGSDHAATPETMRRVTTTLEALSTYGSAPGAPEPGRLSDDVDPPGFETLAALVPGVGRGDRGAGPPRVIQFQQPQRRRPGGRKPGSEEARQAEEEARVAKRAAAQSAVQEAERALRDARHAAQQAEASLKKAAARAKEAEEKKIAAEQRLEKATAEHDAARQEARRVATEAEEAAQAVQDAEQAMDKAKQQLRSLE
jgi:hypothetical protein